MLELVLTYVRLPSTVRGAFINFCTFESQQQLCLQNENRDFPENTPKPRAALVSSWLNFALF